MGLFHLLISFMSQALLFEVNGNNIVDMMLFSDEKVNLCYVSRDLVNISYHLYSKFRIFIYISSFRRTSETH